MPDHFRNLSVNLIKVFIVHFVHAGERWQLRKTHSKWYLGAILMKLNELAFGELWGQSRSKELQRAYINEF